MLHSYNLFTLRVASNVALPELQPAAAGVTDLQFRVFTTPYRGPSPASWYHEWLMDDGQPWLALGKTSTGFFLRFPDLADFTIAPDLTAADCYARSCLAAETTRHLFLDQVLPLILSGRGFIVLHASAVDVGGRAAAFLGNSGQGKSTLAASFARDGCSILTDDCLVLSFTDDQLRVLPSYPGLRLTRESISMVAIEDEETASVAPYTLKRRVANLPFAASSLPLERLYLLGETESNDVQIEPLPAGEAFIELVKFKYRLDISDRSRLAEEFPRLLRLAELGVYRLSYRHEFALLPKVHQAISKHLLRADRNSRTRSWIR